MVRADDVIQYPGRRLVTEENNVQATSLAASVFYTKAARIHYVCGGQSVAHQVPHLLHQKTKVETEENGDLRLSI